MTEPSIKQKIRQWLKKKPDVKRQIKALRFVAILYGIIGILFIAMACYAAFSMSLTFVRDSSSYQVLNPEQLRAVAFGSVLSVFAGMSITGAGFCLMLSVWAYTQSLELRIRQLEKKQETKQVADCSEHK